MQAVTVESRSSFELWTGFYFCFTLCTCGICSLLSVLCCTTGIDHFGSEPDLRHRDCFFSSPLGLRDLSLHHHANVNNLVAELQLGATQLSSAPAKRSRPVCACSCGASFNTETVSSKIDSGISTSTICSTIRSGTCSWHVSFVFEQSSSLVQSMPHNV